MKFHLSAIAAAFAFSLPAQAQSPAPDSRLIERGAYLVNGIAACGNCHFQRDQTGKPLFDKGLSGGMVFDEEPFRAVASNITNDAETGVGKWTDAQLVRAIREGLRPDGTVIGPPMPIGFYRGMADADVKAIVAWMRAQPAVQNKVAKSEYRMPLPPNYGPEIRKPIKAPSPKDTIKYGAYLAGPMGHCLECHTPWVKGQPDMARVGAGGNPFKGPWGVSVAANLTPHETGLKGWTPSEIERAIRSGVKRDGSPLKPPMGYGFYANINAADMKALIAYLRSMKPQKLGGA